MDKNLVSTNPQAWWVILASLLTMVLYLVPFLHPLAYPFMLLSTLVHEMGHGFSALCLVETLNPLRCGPMVQV